MNIKYAFNVSNVFSIVTLLYYTLSILQSDVKCKCSLAFRINEHYLEITSYEITHFVVAWSFIVQRVLAV